MLKSAKKFWQLMNSLSWEKKRDITLSKFQRKISTWMKHHSVQCSAWCHIQRDDVIFTISKILYGSVVFFFAPGKGMYCKVIFWWIIIFFEYFHIVSVIHLYYTLNRFTGTVCECTYIFPMTVKRSTFWFCLVNESSFASKNCVSLLAKSSK